MKIRNINGISDPPCACGSWMQHWEKFSGQKTTFCQVVGCMEKDLVGAHIQKADAWDDTWYIYPLCNFHNQRSKELQVSDGYKLVPADKAETCEK